MDLDRIIVDFYDGVASSGDKEKLFSSMASDTTLREKFINMGEINTAAMKSVYTFSPPTDVTNSIYSRLGYSVPPGLIVKESVFKRKKVFFGYIFSTLSAAALTIGIMLTFFPSTKQIIQVPYPVEKKQSISTQVPFTKSEGNIIRHKVSREQPPPQAMPSLATVEAATEETSIPEAKKEPITIASAIPVISRYDIGTTKAEHYIPDNFSYDKPLFFKNHEPLGITVGFNGSAVWDTPKATIPSNYVSPFSNLCISVNYALSPHFRIGLEARQESFYTEYTGTEGVIVYLYKQQSNFATIGADIRWLPLSLSLFNPYLGFSTGANVAGVVLRPDLGLEYQVYSDIGFMLGFEYSYFLFMHQNTPFHTGKVGLNYGVLITF